jgi:hypothetical protein
MRDLVVEMESFFIILEGFILFLYHSKYFIPSVSGYVIVLVFLNEGLLHLILVSSTISLQTHKPHQGQFI